MAGLSWPTPFLPEMLPQPNTRFRGRTAKELGIALTEKGDSLPLSRLDHAMYLGRELQKAEDCLKAGRPYRQD